MPKVSIICPVYNVGQYISKFLISLQKQTFQDFEVVFVYDECKDDSYQHIASFANKTEFKGRAKIIVNKTKKGAGYARDLGYENSNCLSKYVLFLDSDDYFEDDFIESLVEKAEETDADITCCGYSRIDEKDGNLLCNEMINNPDIITNILCSSYPIFLINSAAWNKLYKREVADKCKFGNSKCAEDLYYLLSAIAVSQRIAFVNKLKYTYLIHANSLINTLSYDKFENACFHFKDFLKYKDNAPLFSLISAFVFIRIGVGTTMRVLLGQKTTKNKVFKEAKKYMKANFAIFKSNRYLSFGFLKKHGKRGFAIWILKIAYLLNFFPFLIKIYSLRAKRQRKEVRW